MKKQRKDKQFVKNAFYKGGNKAMGKFVSENLMYPKTALENKIHGTIHIKYDVNHRGKVFKVKLLNSLGYGCDEEAKRVIRLLQFEVPKTRGLRLTFHKEIHIHFRMPKKTNIQEVKEDPKPIENPIEKTASIEVEYQVVKSSDKQKETSDNKSNDSNNSYNYTISL